MTDEAQRMAALAGYGLMDTPNEPEFDAIVREAARRLGVPIALISLVDEHRQWFKARVGLDAAETPRSISFCTHAIRGREVMVVEGAAADPRFARNPLVTGADGIRFYAGAPLCTPDGQRIGTLCVIDRKPRHPSEAETRMLERLASETVALFSLRQRRRAAAEGE